MFLSFSSTKEFLNQLSIQTGKEDKVKVHHFRKQKLKMFLSLSIVGRCYWLVFDDEILPGKKERKKRVIIFL